MFRRRKKKGYRYLVEQSFAETWPDVLALEGFSVDLSKRWARHATNSTGFPWGKVGNGHTSIQVGAAYFDEQCVMLMRGNIPAGHHFLVSILLDESTQLLMERLSNIVVSHGGRLINITDR